MTDVWWLLSALLLMAVGYAVRCFHELWRELVEEDRRHAPVHPLRPRSLPEPPRVRRFSEARPFDWSDDAS